MMTLTVPLRMSEGSDLPEPEHPLEPLAPREIAAASALLKAHPDFPEGSRFVYVELAEPAKEAVFAWTPGTAWDRQAAVLLRSPQRKATLKALVSLTGQEVLSLVEVPGQAPLTFEEMLAAEEVVRQDPRWQAAMRQRGVEDFALAMLDLWASGHTGPDDDPDKRRIGRLYTFVRSHPDDNGYARPVEGLVVTMDMDEMAVVDVADHGVVPLPPKTGDYLPELLGENNVPAFTGQRAPLKPIVITQPEGPSFTVDGYAVSWANWRLRIGFTPREGLVLHDVRYVDKRVERTVLHRASLSEMYVPYGDPSPTHWNKNVFDEGEYGLGWMANPLTLGCDCLGEIRYFDGHVNDQDGLPVTIGNAICMHEEDASIGWKHTDYRTGHAEVRRNRRLVISSIATVGNYDYGFYWNLYLDGSIEFEIKLTGILSVGATEPGSAPTYGTLIAPGLFAPNHEHYFSVRLDMRVDSDRNNLYEVDSVAESPGAQNPHGNAWRTVKTQLTSEYKAQRLPNSLAGRTWLISSADTTTTLGAAPSYKLEPGAYTAPLWLEGSQQANRGVFATKQLWATQYCSDERWAAGEFIAQHPGGGGLPEYTASDRSLVDADLVLWYTVGAHHVVRPEDWPVMPVTRVGFHLKPFGFFDGNPILDLPAERHAAPTGDGPAPAGDCHCG